MAVSLHSTSGCRPRPEGFCRVEGRVTVDALPVEAELTFYPLEGTAARPVIVVTDAAGRFIVDPRSPKQQLPPGRYRIDIRIRSVHHVPETADSDGEPKAGKGRVPTYLLTVRLQRRLSAPVTRLRFALRS
ncbi:MAG: hypothetical protein D6725_03830 [Planctomycetota bacterium]|nr:MAG: hypothetical protein D6725_03830 [Planctomycetota bacterium]